MLVNFLYMQDFLLLCCTFILNAPLWKRGYAAFEPGMRLLVQVS